MRLQSPLVVGLSDNLDLSHVLGKVMCPNRGAKIPDYGVQDHIAQVCAPFFQGIESRSQYESRWH